MTDTAKRFKILFWSAHYSEPRWSEQLAALRSIATYDNGELWYRWVDEQLSLDLLNELLSIATQFGTRIKIEDTDIPPSVTPRLH